MAHIKSVLRFATRDHGVASALVYEAGSTAVHFGETKIAN
jgi:hypothetical protein